MVTNPTAARRLADRVLELFLVLPQREQLRIFAPIAGFVGDTSPELQPEVSTAADRRAIMEAFEEISRKHGLPRGQPPNADHLRKARRTMPDTPTLHQINEAFGSLRTAQAVYAGERTTPVPRTLKQRAIWKRAAGTARRWEDYLIGVRIWLDSNPESLFRWSYDDFARAWNAALESSSNPDDPSAKRLVQGHAIQCALHMGWEEIVEAARLLPRLTLPPQPAPPRRIPRLPADHRLMGLNEIATLLGVSTSKTTRLAADPTFPRPAATFGAGRVWLAIDIEDVHHGRESRKRRANWLQLALLDIHGVGKLLGLKTHMVHQHLRHGRHDLVPPPFVRLARIAVWRTVDVRPRVRHAPNSR